MGVCGSRWGRSLGLGFPQLRRTLHPPDFPFHKMWVILYLWVIGLRTVRGVSGLFVVGSVRSSPIPR
jgi:hypothetical protein